ncbi:hypothetical protein EVAR_30083_1 [Eumeta japonica]|uniref:Uncharacterized protein n=1 Tax=Eumeta variegata TaxID=151549 RepID=A0A4C1XBL1_EUMVA|nr:hypothetical protein EVAR_30083_1 [Eumeta japonica]
MSDIRYIFALQVCTTTSRMRRSPPAARQLLAPLLIHLRAYSSVSVAVLSTCGSSVAGSRLFDRRPSDDWLFEPTGDGACSRTRRHGRTRAGAGRVGRGPPRNRADNANEHVANSRAPPGAQERSSSS